ncbi:inositol-pentakisphosphate 2-kinase [Sphaerosporella brunnea]|uniref:Inositol-pentakisphosphate 2-kinase n=1 Tax=Sphaerosporella brunnea TaxID=1250544 RepID=A0A5J5FBL4_9PEZI|nr:inositol-pentakisphosphate 2-kinase [Sphaerosporella brunnea]
MTTTITTVTKPVEENSPLLPADIELTYLAEGAANIIYRLQSPTAPSSGPFSSTVLSTRLIRLRKALPSAQPNKATFNYISHTAFPLFPSSLLVSTELVRVPRAVLERENARLLSLEALGARSKKRHGLYLETMEEYAFLVADMSARTGREVLVEFKPKWVVQSPSAPQDARRCRTCALRLKKDGGRGFCPLDLASGEAARIRRAVDYLLPQKPPKGFELRELTWELEKTKLEEKVVDFLMNSELMPTLAGLQTRLDPQGPLGEMKKGFLDAMTVRDLTVFLRVDMDAPSGGVECGIGDLDMKSKENGKEAYWRDTERGLVEGGFYELDSS